MAITQKLREIGGIINSTDLNFDKEYSQVETIADRNNIPSERLTQGFWCAVSENGVVYEYNKRNDLVTASTEERYFGINDGDLPNIPYVVDGDPTSGVLLNAKYICRADGRDNNWKYTFIFFFY